MGMCVAATMEVEVEACRMEWNGMGLSPMAGWRLATVQSEMDVVGRGDGSRSLGLVAVQLLVGHWEAGWSDTRCLGDQLSTGVLREDCNICMGEVASGSALGSVWLETLDAE